jgi:3-hydroxyisobutyrate dehydrogenase-like beta-hydroxyacid dehydrogenase
VLAAMTKAQFYLGGSGAGATMKLAVNAIIALTNEAVAEALVLAESAGVGRADAYAVLAASAIASPFVQYKQAAFLDPDSSPVGFTTALMQKDLELALALAREHGVSMPATAAANEVLTLARRLGYGEGDLVRVADALRLDPTAESVELH